LYIFHQQAAKHQSSAASCWVVCVCVCVCMHVRMHARELGI
jgi:hypothetical protein